ncbi:MAG: hypothetical protein HQK91_05910 [Nitrospirae bacterium]|nr:hypothetical protein [Nitrospirota bacterium]
MLNNEFIRGLLYKYTSNINIGVICLIIGIAFIIGFLLRYEKDRNYEKYGVLVNATLISKESVHIEKSHYYYINYKFKTKDGIIKVGRDKIGYDIWKRFREGNLIIVQYLHNDPSSSRMSIDLDEEYRLIVIIFTIGCLSFLIGGVLLFKAVKGVLKYLRISRNGILAEATVISSLSTKKEGFTNFRQSNFIVLQYTYNDLYGRPHNDKIILHPKDASKYKSGDKCTVRYESTAPEKSAWISK